MSNPERSTKSQNMDLLKSRGETLASFILREVKPGDLPELAALHVKAWSETYWQVTEPPTYEIREYQWRKQFTVTDGSWFCYVVANGEGKLVGFAKGMRYGHANFPDFNGELNKIYLLRDYQRLGLGRKLVNLVARRFATMGIDSMILFADPENPSCLFYEALGGEKIFPKMDDFQGTYGWRDLAALAELTN